MVTHFLSSLLKALDDMHLGVYIDIGIGVDKFFIMFFISWVIELVLLYFGRLQVHFSVIGKDGFVCPREE